MAEKQGAGMGSLYIVAAFFTSGVLTFVFHGLSTRALGEAAYGELAVLWSATFLTVQVLWISITQTLGRHMAEREARGESWRSVTRSVRRLQVTLLGVFLLACLLASPLLTGGVFGGEWALTFLFLAAVAAYAPEYYRRGEFNGHRQFSRLGALHVAESTSRVLLATALLVAGAGVIGPALAIVAAPLVGVLLVRPRAGTPPEREGEPFSAAGAFRFAGPVLLCVACAQAFMNGGPLLVGLLGGTREQPGLLLAALILTRVPQYVLSPAIQALLPHASRALNTQGRRGFDRFVVRAAGLVAGVGVALVAGVWLLGEWAMRVVYGPGFEAGRTLLVTLAVLAALYLLCEVLNQALFALGRARLAALGWLTGLPASAACLALLQMELLDRVAYSLALGVLVAALAQTAFYLVLRGRPVGASGEEARS